MSRSYKKTPIYKDSSRKGPTYKSGKQIANRAVRRKKDIPNGSGYRKAFNSWDISDYSFRMSERDLRRNWERQDSMIRKSFRSFKEAYRWWLRYHRSK